MQVGQRHLTGGSDARVQRGKWGSPWHTPPSHLSPVLYWCKAPCSDCRAVRGGGTVRLLLAQSRHGLRCCISKVNPSKTQKTFWVLQRASRPSGPSVCGLLREQDAPEREPLSPGMQRSGVCFPAPSGPAWRRHRQLSVVIHPMLPATDEATRRCTVSLSVDHTARGRR